MRFSQLVIIQSIGLLISLGCCCNSFAEAIYQWSDPWGQVQYSKTQVPGSMLSDLTELPETQKTTEQKKQQVMVHKIQELENADSRLIQKNTAENYIRQQNKKNQHRCRKLRYLLAEVRLRNSRSHYYDRYHYPEHPLYTERNYSDELLERDLYWQIREYCR